jgi:hypothetical protein
VEDLFVELKPHVEALAEPLFGASEMFVRKRGAFLPHGAVLAADGEVRLIMAGSDDDGDRVSSTDVLPRLHDGLRSAAHDDAVEAVAVCEDVTITPAGEKPTKAIKVLVEHRRGLTVALYLPWRRKFFVGRAFGQVMATAAEPEVLPWADPETA